MQNIILKIYLSVMVCILCLITLFTSTFAWIGLLSVSSIENFTIDIEASKLEEYGVEISLTGEPDSFGTTVDVYELKKIILQNYGYSASSLETNEDIDKLFSKIVIDQCTVNPNDDNSFPDFVDMNNNPTKSYFKFDLYISTYQVFDNDTTDYLLDVYLVGDLFEGTIRNRDLINGFTYPSNFINPEINGIQGGTSLKNNIAVDSASAARLAIQKYNVVEKYKPEQYEELSTINDLIIYQGGKQLPTYDEQKKLYSFGGILPDEYNLAVYDWNLKYPLQKKAVPEWAINRGDIFYDTSKSHQIIDSTNSNEKIGVNDMMKMTVYFWFEGWDADCFDVINKSPVSINLKFSVNEK